MKRIRLDGYLLKQKINLEKLATFFGVKLNKNYPYVQISGQALGHIYKYLTTDKSIFVFSYGSVVFVDCTSEEAGIAIRFFENMIGKIDYAGVIHYHNTHEIILENNAIRIYHEAESASSIGKEAAISISAMVLARSIALKQVENRVEQHVEGLEKFLDDMKRGILKFLSRRYMKRYLEIIKTEFRLIHKIGILDTDFLTYPSIKESKASEQLKNWFDLYGRYQNCMKKINYLNHVLNEYMDLAYKGRTQLQDALTMVFLFLFPLSGLLERLIHL